MRASSDFGRELLALAAGAALELHHALLEAARPHDRLPGQADQVHRRELGARALVAIVDQDLDAGPGELALEAGDQGIAPGIAGPQIDEAELEGRHRLRPFDPGVVVEHLDEGGCQARDADAVGAHLDRHLLAVRPGHGRAHGLGVLGAEIEDLADLDAAPGAEALRRHRAARRIVLLVGRGVESLEMRDRPFVRDGVKEIDLLEREVVIHLALAGRRQDLELVAHVAADRPARRPHRDRGQIHAPERPQIGHEHVVVGAPRAREVQVEGVVVLHQELAAAHHPEARPDLVAELPLDLVEIDRQVAIASDAAAEDVGHHLLVRRAVEHRPLVPVGDPQHLLAVVLVATALLPELGRLDRRHQGLVRAGRVHLLAHDLLDPAQHAKAERQPAVDAGRALPDHAGAQHELMRDDLRLARHLPQEGQEISRQTHAPPRARSSKPAPI